MRLNNNIRWKIHQAIEATWVPEEDVRNAATCYRERAKWILTNDFYQNLPNVARVMYHDPELRDLLQTSQLYLPHDLGYVCICGAKRRYTFSPPALELAGRLAEKAKMIQRNYRTLVNNLTFVLDRCTSRAEFIAYLPQYDSVILPETTAKVRKVKPEQLSATALSYARFITDVAPQFRRCPVPPPAVLRPEAVQIDVASVPVPLPTEAVGLAPEGMPVELGVISEDTAAALYTLAVDLSAEVDIPDVGFASNAVAHTVQAIEAGMQGVMQ